MIELERLEAVFQQARERALKLHEALEIPYITAYHGQIVEMLHGEIIQVIEPNEFGSERISSLLSVNQVK